MKVYISRCLGYRVRTLKSIDRAGNVFTICREPKTELWFMVYKQIHFQFVRILLLEMHCNVRYRWKLSTAIEGLRPYQILLFFYLFLYFAMNKFSSCICFICFSLHHFRESMSIFLLFLVSDIFTKSERSVLKFGSIWDWMKIYEFKVIHIYNLVFRNLHSSWIYKNSKFDLTI